MSDLIKVRRLPAEDERVETGPIMFGDDWPGTFIRGDDAFLYLTALRRLMLDNPDTDTLIVSALRGLLSDLESSDARNNDAFPAWHIKGEGQS